MTKDTSTNRELESHLHGQGETVAAGVSDAKLADMIRQAHANASVFMPGTFSRGRADQTLSALTELQSLRARLSSIDTAGPAGVDMARVLDGLMGAVGRCSMHTTHEAAERLRREMHRSLIINLRPAPSAIGGEAEPVAWRDVLRKARDMLGRSGDGPYIEIERAVGSPIIDFIEDELDALYLARQGGVK